MAYNGIITKLEKVKKAEGSDFLYTATCFGEGIIVGEDAKEGEIVLYLPADGAVERWFGDEFGLFRKNIGGTAQGGYLEDSGHIRAIKLRGNQSSGIAISWEKLVTMFPSLTKYKIGDEINEIDGKIFVFKYIPKQRNFGHAEVKTSYKGRKAEGVIYPEFSMHTDTAQLAYNEGVFHAGDLINFSLKVHGTSQRSMNTYAELPNGFFRKLFKMKKKTKEAYVLGTRRCVVTENSTGFYGNDNFRIPHHKKIQPFVLPGMEIYYEVVGYQENGGAIMPSADNKKLNDKSFSKQFGATTEFSYGCEVGQSEMYVYRITDDKGEFSPSQIIGWCEKADVPYVPQIEEFEFTTWEDLLSRVNKYFEDLTDPIGKTHLKEGVVVRILNRRNFAAYKSKTYEFKVLEGIIKETATEADIEESQEI